MRERSWSSSRPSHRPHHDRSLTAATSVAPSRMLPAPMAADALPATRSPDGFDDPAFRARRTQNWLVLGLPLLVLLRHSVQLQPPSAPALGATSAGATAQYGIFETMMPLVYGASVLINGPLADRIGGKKAFLLGAAGVVVMNFLFGLGTLVVVTPAVWDGRRGRRRSSSPRRSSATASGPARSSR